MKAFFEKSTAVFFMLAFLFIPLTFSGLDWQFQLTRFLFSRPTSYFQDLFFPNALTIIDFSSDTIRLHILLFILLLISMILVFLFKKVKIKKDKTVLISKVISCYYLAFILLKYGFDKIFKAQFYLPEPNILVTPFGDLSKDILYWSTIGTSYFYSLSMGIIEVITAFLILFRPTRVLGLLVAIGVFVNVICINFGFDISVKMFSIFLFFTTIFAVSTYLKTLFIFFIFHKTTYLNDRNEKLFINSFLKNGLKTLVIGFFLIQILYPYFQSKNFNDDNQQRPFLHGVYQVIEMKRGDKIVNKNNFPIQKIVIHRNNFIIFQDENDKMTDYHFKLNKQKKQLIIENYKQNSFVANYEFTKKDSTFRLNFKNYFIVSKAINWKKFPAINSKWHYTIDQILY